MDIQRLRNLTTGRLHTDIVHVYEDIEHLTGAEGVMTHQLPNACKALLPYLREVAPDPRLWDDQHDPSHTGTIDIEPMNDEQRAEYWKRYGDLPSLLG